MICKYCNKVYNINDSWKSSKFCSSKCRSKYANSFKKDKVQKDIINKYKMLAKNPKLSPRNIGGNYGVAADITCRANPLRPFLHINYSDDIRKSIVRRYIDNKNVIDSLVNLSIKYNTTGLMYKFLQYIICHFPHISNELSKLYKTMSTWEIAGLFHLDQRTICRIYGKNGLSVTNRSMKCSKIHLKTKPIIEEILNVKTETEHYLNGYWIDEFSEELKLCVEIDGAWCHNVEYDKIRDERISKLGYSTVRIPAYSDYDTIKELLSPYIKE